MYQTSLTNVQEVDVSVDGIVSASGSLLDTDGPVSVVSLDPTIATIENLSSDGRQFVIRTTGVVGSTTVVLHADIDLTSGVLDVSDAIEVTVSDSGEVTFNISFGTPRHR